MDFNKCKRCGCFFITDGETCPSCTPKDNNEIFKLNNYFLENENSVTIHELSSITGISTKNLSRFVSCKNFNFKKQIIL
ncbi:MAG: hypothetical protein J6A89_04500 [Clostridia bacterium]|nr:hypothetical protein [Clostridia bacterium]